MTVWEFIPEEMRFDLETQVSSYGLSFQWKRILAYLGEQLEQGNMGEFEQADDSPALHSEIKDIDRRIVQLLQSMTAAELGDLYQRKLLKNKRTLITDELTVIKAEIDRRLDLEEDDEFQW